MFRYILIFILIFSLTGCELLFNETDNEYIVLDNDQEIVDLLNGIYYHLTLVHDGNYKAALIRSDDLNVYGTISFSPEGNFSKMSIPCSDEGRVPYDIFKQQVDNIYKNLYKGITNANAGIEQATNNQLKLLGELYFLRAYSYFKLARFFGRPPLVTDIDVDFNMKKPSFEEIYEQIENDLLFAIDMLPNAPAKARIAFETPIKSTAQALLAEVYLTMGGFPINNADYYYKAANMANEVINSYNYELLPDMANLWKRSYSHNSENIFGLYYSPDPQGSYVQSNTYNPTTITASWLASNEVGFSIIPIYQPEIKFYVDYPNNYRKYTSLWTGSYSKQNYNFQNNFVSSIDFKELDPLKTPCDYVDKASSIKYIDLTQLQATKGESSTYISGSNCALYLLRYAQTLLTFAEAKARSGQIDELAYEAINKVRRRANKKDPNTISKYDLTPNLNPAQFIDSVVWERAWELCSEPEGRWFDIIRLDLKDKLDSEYRYLEDFPSKFPQKYVTDDWYFYEIPQEDKWINDNF